MARASFAITMLYFTAGLCSAAAPQAQLNEALAGISHEVSKSPLPGLVVGITDRERTLAVFANGYADIKTRTALSPDTPFAIGSISKSFTAIALLQLEDQGRFDPQAPVARYLPWFKVVSNYEPITGHHLLTHTAGLPNYLPDLASSRQAVAALSDFEVSYAPGAHFWYSNTGYQVLGYVLEDIEKASYAAILQRRVLAPLHMSSTHPVIDDSLRKTLPVSYQRWPYDESYVEQPWFEYTAADGGVTSSASDMCTYIRMLLNSGRIPGGRLISERAFAQLTTPVLENYAYGLDVQGPPGDRVVAHDGGIAGFVSRIEAHTDDGFGIVFLGNGGLDGDHNRWIRDTLRAAYHGQALPPAPAWEAPERTSVARYAGLYRSPQGDEIRFGADKGVLRLLEGDKAVALIRMDDDSFRLADASSDPLPFLFGRVGEQADAQVIEVSHGVQWYANPAYEGKRGQKVFPASFRAYVGHYVSHGPEGPGATVFVRRGRLMLVEGGDAAPGLEDALIPTGEGTFRRATPDYNPERYRFDSIVAGQSLRLLKSGTPMYRIDTP